MSITDFTEIARVTMRSRSMLRLAPESSPERHPKEIQMSDHAAPVVVIGAGFAGLCCARELHRAGVPVLLLEAERQVGGRVRTERDDEGFLIDRGFQVMLSAYPALRRHIDLDALGAAPFDSGAMIWSGRRRIPLAHPFLHPDAILRDLTSTVFPASDKLRLAAWALAISRKTWPSAANVANEQPADRSALDALRERGFSDAFIDRFARPFWGGILLDRSLSASAGVLDFTLRMFIGGSGVLPREGLGAVPAAITLDLPGDAIRTGARVAALQWEGGAVSGVSLADGGRIAASAVVVATDPPAAAELTGIGTIPTKPVGCVTVYLSGQTDPGVGKRLVLDGTGKRSVNHIAPLSTVQPTYAPAGSHLIAAVMLGEDALGASDDDLSGRALADVGLMLGQPGKWSVRHIVRVPFALYRQEPGVHRRLPDAATGITGLFLASDATVDASVNGALLSGESAARAVRAARYA